MGKKSSVVPQSKRGKYSARLSDTSFLGNHKSFRTNDSFYRLVVESLGQAIFTTDKDGNVSSWNIGAQKLFGYKEKEIIGKNASLIFRQEDINHHQLQKELHKAAARGKVVIERYHRRKNGSQFWASGLIFSLIDEKNIARGFTFIVRDLTEKMEFEKRRDEFISTATHELKLPITSLKLYAEIVEEEIKKSKDKAIVQSVSELNKQVDRVTSLMDYLLDVDKVRKGKLELKKTSFDINELIKETVAAIQLGSKKHKIVRKGHIDELAYGDRNRLGQVLINLITNAIKYSPEANKVIVSVKKDANNLIVSIEDFGFGIAKSEQSEIFGRFYRANSARRHDIGGIGLGLYVARQIVVAHKGKMWLESEEGKGSTFYFTLPRDL